MEIQQESLADGKNMPPLAEGYRKMCCSWVALCCPSAADCGLWPQLWLWATIANRKLQIVIISVNLTNIHCIGWSIMTQGRLGVR